MTEAIDIEQADPLGEERLRLALGQHNDSAQPVSMLIKRLRTDRDRLLQQLLAAKPDAERYRLLLDLGDRWISQARAVAAASDDAPTIDEQLDLLLVGRPDTLDLPAEAGTGYRMPYHPTRPQLVCVCQAIKPDWPSMRTEERSRLESKIRKLWRAIAETINNAGTN